MMLPKTKMFGFSNNNMVAQRNAKQLAGGSKLLGKGSVFLARLGLARRMVVRHDHAGGAINNGVGKHLARMRQHRVERANGDSALSQQALSAVKRQTHKIFLLFGADV